MKIYGVFLNNLVYFIFFLSPERKPKQKKECENVLSSEAGTQILQITQRTRYAQTAFRISLLRLRTAIRDSIAIQRICIPLKTSSCGMFSNVVSKHDAPCGNREALATEGTQEFFRVIYHE